MSYCDFDNDYEYCEDSYYEVMTKNSDLVSIGENMKNSMCNIGQRKVKLLLNSLIKNGDRIANMYKQILECENYNINAKKYYNTRKFNYREYYYQLKRDAIDKLIKDVIDYNSTVNDEDKIVFGRQDSDVYSTADIIYFEIPGLQQISFHTDIGESIYNDVPEYEHEWDQQINSTLNKIEYGINHRYADELKQKYGNEIDAYIEKMKQKKDNEQKKKEEQDTKIAHIVDVINTGDCAQMYSLACSIEYGYLFNRAFKGCDNESNKIDYVFYLSDIQMKHNRLMQLYNQIQTNGNDINAVYKAIIKFVMFKQSIPSTFDDVIVGISNKYMTDLVDTICRYNGGAFGKDGDIKLIKFKDSIIFGDVPPFGNIVCKSYSTLTNEQKQYFANVPKFELKRDFKYRHSIDFVVNEMKKTKSV